MIMIQSADQFYGHGFIFNTSRGKQSVEMLLKLYF